jgi:hypothetical protein
VRKEGPGKHHCCMSWESRVWIEIMAEAMNSVITMKIVVVIVVVKIRIKRDEGGKSCDCGH